MPGTENLPDDEELPQPPLRIVRIWSAYRRCLIYLAIGGWLCLLLAALVPRRPVDPIGASLSVLIAGVLPGIAWLIATTYLVRIDEQGISRRRLGFWTLWPWEDCVAGKVQFRVADGWIWLSNSNRPLWDRIWPALAFLEPTDLQFLLELIHQQTPTSASSDQVAIPFVAQVELNLFPFRRLTLSQEGCIWQRTGMKLAWNQIESLRIQRFRSKSQDRYEFALKAQGRGNYGVVTKVRRSDEWIEPRTDEHELWLAQLQQLVPPEKFTYVRSHGELRSLEEGEYRLKNLADQLRAMGWFEVIGWGSMVASFIFFVPKMLDWWNTPFLPLGWRIAGVVLILLTSLMPPLILIAVSRHVRRISLGQQAIIEQEIAALQEAEVKSVVNPPPESRLAPHAIAP
jgi:hypothetical protein